LYDCDRVEHDSSPEMVEQLRKQLREKDLVLTDIRLEALSSAHQLESLKDTVIKMRVSNINSNLLILIFKFYFLCTFYILRYIQLNEHCYITG